MNSSKIITKINQSHLWNLLTKKTKEKYTEKKLINKSIFKKSKINKILENTKKSISKKPLSIIKIILLTSTLTYLFLTLLKNYLN